MCVFPKLGAMLAPVVRALDFAVEKSGNFNTEVKFSCYEFYIESRKFSFFLYNYIKLYSYFSYHSSK